MGQLMAALVKYADSDSTKVPASDEEKIGKGKKNGNGKGSSTTQRIKEAINVRLMVTRSLWLMLMPKVTIRGLRESRLLGLAGQVRILSSYSMSPTRDTAPGSGPLHTRGKIARS